MGRKTRNRITYDTEESYTESESEEDDNIDSRPWSLIIQDRDDDIYKCTDHYKNIEYRLRYVGIIDIDNIIMKLYNNPDLLYKKYIIDKDDIYKLREYVLHIYKIYNLELKPYIIDNEEDIYMSLEYIYIDNFINYIIYELNKIFNKYFISNNIKKNVIIPIPIINLKNI